MMLTFLGAAGEVTGSCLRVDHERGAFLVDCGLFQGGREADRKNRDASISSCATSISVLLTHAHLDHSGLLPRPWHWDIEGASSPPRPLSICSA